MNFIKEIFSPNGSVSWSRVGSFLALISSISWVSWVVWKNSSIPDLAGITLFVTSLYGLGKLGETVQNRDKNDQKT